MYRITKYFSLHFYTNWFSVSVAKGLLTLIFFGALISADARANSSIKGKVTSVIDGNTMEIYTLERKTLTVLLAGIDCPEMGQQYGQAAKDFLEKMVLNKDVVVEVEERDRHGQYIGILLLSNEVDPRVELLKAGLAWIPENESSNELDHYRTFAQRKERGLWKQENPVPPWVFRRQQATKPKIQ